MKNWHIILVIGVILLGFLVVAAVGTYLYGFDRMKAADRDKYTITSSSELNEVLRIGRSKPVKVEILNYPSSDSEVHQLISACDVQSLDVSGCKLVTLSAFIGHPAPVNISTLAVAYTSVGPDLGKLLLLLPNIADLDVRGNRWTVFDSFIASKRHNLWRLDCSQCFLTSEVLFAITALPTLRWLRLDDVEGLTTRDFDILHRCLALEELILARNELDADCLERICNIPTLENLVLIYPRGLDGSVVKRQQQLHPNLRIQFHERSSRQKD